MDIFAILSDSNPHHPQPLSLFFDCPLCLAARYVHKFPKKTSNLPFEQSTAYVPFHILFVVTRRAILQRNSNQKVQCGMVTRAKAPNFNNNEFFIWNFRHEKITVYESRRAIETEGRFEYFSLTAHGISCIFRLSATNTLCTYGFVYSPNTTDDSSAIFCTFSGPGLG